MNTYYERGVSKYNLGRYTEAIADFDKAIALEPDNASAYEFLEQSQNIN